MPEPTPNPTPNPTPPPPPPPAPPPEPKPPEPNPAPEPTPPGDSHDWRSGIEDPDLKDLAKRIASPADAIRSIAELRKANGSMVKLPGKDAKPEDLTKFRKAIGAPEKVEDYKFDVEGHEATDVDLAIRTEAAKVLHEFNAPAELAPRLSKMMATFADTMEAERERIAVEARTASEAQLQKEWGADYEPNKNLALRAIKAFGSPALVSFFNETHIDGKKLGDHPELIRAFGQIGRRMGEGKFIGSVGAEEKQTLQGELEQLYRDNPVGTDKFNQPSVQKRMREINVALHGEAPAVGQMGRST